MLDYFAMIRRNPILELSVMLRRLAVVMGLLLLLALVAFALGRAGLTSIGQAGELPQDKVVRQSGPYSCGAAALATILTYQFGQATSEGRVIEELSARVSPAQLEAAKGYTLLDLEQVVRARGLEGAGYRGLDLSGLRRLGPAIVPLDLKGGRHFVVFRGASGDKVLLADPAAGTVTMAIGDFERLWHLGIGFAVSQGQNHDPGEHDPGALAAGAADFTAPASAYGGGPAPAP